MYNALCGRDEAAHPKTHSYVCLVTPKTLSSVQWRSQSRSCAVRWTRARRCLVRQLAVVSRVASACNAGRDCNLQSFCLLPRPLGLQARSRVRTYAYTSLTGNVVPAPQYSSGAEGALLLSFPSARKRALIPRAL